MSSVQPPQESASRAGRLDRILRDLLLQTPGVEAAAVVSFDGLPMASALPNGMDEDRVAAMSAALLSLAERAAQGLGRGDLSQVYIEGEHGTVFLVSAQDEGVLIAVTSAGAKVGMMLYEVKLAANRVGEVLRGPAPLPQPLPSYVTRDYIDEQRVAPTAATASTASAAAAPAPVPAPAAAPASIADVAAEYVAQAAYAPVDSADPLGPSTYAPVGGYAIDPYGATGYADTSTHDGFTDALGQSGDEPAVDDAEAAPATAEPTPWSTYAPSGSVLPSERSSWS
jgi:predicted regulator of Ras-like GTPase activity (Roadblock/LC7/MglB family)